ncbi:KTSC domain-containing protein [Massilia pseudoviolaceinigra]|uniref:KTSC domain-containing protein n=1 Tax=Massilia pseudoviolaceinigra TaxID=3057165 RepID=UPI002796813F|nr:KTSC domain-containing protein [Massilia sp. CCM 9206]MDQ1921693.1 KTSC domain-containing protein [Massilia sp. CCM 9206]
MSIVAQAPRITLVPVTSSQIAAIGHCADTNTLAVQFFYKGAPGNVYHYQNFTAEDYAAFSGAESVGKHFYKNIKPLADKHPFKNMGIYAEADSQRTGATLPADLIPAAA